jgi:hypothetical protein
MNNASLLSKVIVAFLMFLLGSPSLYGQPKDTIDLILTQPDSILGCNDNIFDVVVYVDSLTSLSIQVFVRDSSGSTADTSCSGISPLIIKMIGSNPFISGQSYNPLTSTWSCIFTPTTIGIFDTISFSYSIIVDCSVIQMDDGEEVTLSNINLMQHWNAVNNNFFDLNNTHLDSIASANIFSPYLIDVAPVNYPSSFGNNNDLYFEYINNGTTANVKFWFDPDGLGNNCDGYSQVGNLMYGVRDTAGAVSYSTYTPSTWQSIPLETGESIVIKRTIEIIDCLDSCNNESSFFKWRCDYSQSADSLFCEDCQETFIHNYSVFTPDSLEPVIWVERIYPDLNTATYDYSCPDDTLQWKFRVKNTGAGDLPILNIDLKYNTITGGDPSNLTLIPASSISVDTSGCPTCTTDTTIILRTNAVLCGLLDPLDSYALLVHDLGAGDSVDLYFSTYRCCSEDSTYLNMNKFFNHWVLLIDGIDSCGNGVSRINAPSPNQPVLVGSSIAGHANNNDPDLDLNLEFIPTISDLTVPKNQFFGPSATMNITFQGMFPSINDYQIVGCDDDTTCLMKGYLRARIHAEEGLHMQFFDSVYFVLDTLQWIPEFYTTDVADTSTCTDGNYFFYFNLSDSIARQMIKTGDFIFQLQACCGESGISNYDVAFYLLMNPDSCISLIAPDTIYEAPVCVDCCWMPLSSKGDGIHVHCPGCVWPGMIVDAYKLERMNYGLEDGDNNRRADLPLSQIEKDSSYYDNHPLIRSKHSMHGDVLQDIMVAHFEPGTNYTYTSMITSGSTAFLNYLQLNRLIPEASSTSMDLVVHDFDLYIDIPDTTGGCRDCDIQEIADTMFRTIQVNSVPTDSLSIYLLLYIWGRFTHLPKCQLPDCRYLQTV